MAFITVESAQHFADRGIEVVDIIPGSITNPLPVQNSGNTAPIGAIVGGSIAGVVVLLAGAIIFVVVLKKRKEKEE